MKPTIGRIVHYYPHSDDISMEAGPHAAMVVATGADDFLNLHVFGRSAREGDTKVDHVRYSEALEDGTWSWPPKV